MKLFRYIFSAILCFVAITAHCQTISQDEALSRAKRFINSQAPASRAVQSATYTSVDNISDYLYVFNLSTGGWVIVSADKNNNEILGYSLSGHYDKNIPDNVNNVIKGYEKQIKKEIANPIPKSRAAIAEPVKKALVVPLCKTQWNQTNPYNLFCPEENGKKCYTGCVPTAMAQLMAYYKWPEKGHGEILRGYFKTDGLDTLRLDEITIDWKNMCNSYHGGETQAQKEAVATLMKICGWSCGVSYSSSPSGSGAGGNSPCSTLRDFFYYKGELVNPSDKGGEAELHDYLCNVLSQNKPMICWGGPNTDPRSMGHEYICDGYDGKGFFHFNWGWGGSQDGFYKLKGAVYYLNHIILMEPDYDKNGIEDKSTLHAGYNEVVKKDGSVRYEGKNEEGDWIDLSLFYKPGDGVRKCNVKVGLKTINSKGESKIISVYETDKDGIPVNLEYYHVSSTQISYLMRLASELTFVDGEYKCYPIYKRNGENEWYDVKMYYVDSPTYVRMLVENGEITFLTPNPADISVTVKPDRTICVSGKATSIDTNIYNTYGMRVYSGRDEEIKVASPGIYTIVISAFRKENCFSKTVVVK